MSLYPTLKWVLRELDIPLEDAPGYKDGWLSWAGLPANRTIPAIPPNYRQDHEEGRALYVIGFPANTTPVEMRAFFEKYGNVDKCICVVDMVSRFSFRWVVMAAQNGTVNVERLVQGKVFHGIDDRGRAISYMLKVCQAVGPDRHLTIAEGSAAQDFLALPTPELAESTSHAHPSPPTGNLQEVISKEPFGQPSAQCSLKGEGDPEEEQDEYGGQEEATSPTTPTLVTTKPAEGSAPTDGFTSQVASWARIAGTASPNSRVIELHPRTGATPRLKPIGRIPSISSPRDGEAMTDQMRVVFLLDLPPTIGLQDISDAVQEGPLRSINFGTDDTTNEDKVSRYAGVVFQFARDAEMFYAALCKEKADSRPYRFKFIVDAARGPAFPMDEPLKAMGSPLFATRRLTIVKSKFFFMFGERQLRHFCIRLVGDDAIQLIWLYNGGNATVVFANVESAITVKQALDDRAAGRNLSPGQSASTFEGLLTTFSKDPCVAPLELKTAMTTS
ncbi:hypothetical protein BGZ60DRAFT_503473 [Tricladium varicosporioides]|nr:hypothetical protein BGZ60DRAFT_503473 [Hymenoscyphus varicosporioides]